MRRVVLLLLLFIVLPLAELFVILKVGDAIGAVPTILLLAADSVLGAMLLRSQGRRVWARFRDAVERGDMPHREVMDGVLVIFGAAFLITPGFITDIIGVLLLLPPTRAGVRAWLIRRLGKRVEIRTARRRSTGGGDFDVEGTATEYDAPSPRLER
jgi:UPF0716 protein FxsA